MELNTKGRYAVMAMADLAKFGDHGSVSLSTIADRQHLPLAYLEQIFLRLRRAGLVASERGRSGGYRLARLASEISVADVMGAADEPTRMTRCLEAEQGCVEGERCLTHGLWVALGQNISEFLSDVSLEDVIRGDYQVDRANDPSGRNERIDEVRVRP